MDFKAAAAATKEEVHGVVIVGGGLCGLATALALRRKGIESLVVERSEALRVGGVALNVHANGWRALEELGLADGLRETANLITSVRMVRQIQGKNQTIVSPARKEIRCLRRKDVVEALANSVPGHMIRYGCRIVAVDQDPGTNYAVLTMADGNTIKAKVVIGCDGWNSVVAKYLGLGLPSQLPRFIVLGFASYPEGHPFGTEFSQIIADDFAVGRAPVNENLVHFFVSRSPSPGSTDVDEDAARKYVLEKVDELPDDIADMVRRCDAASSWTLTKRRNSIAHHRRYKLALFPWLANDHCLLFTASLAPSMDLLHYTSSHSEEEIREPLPLRSLASSSMDFKAAAAATKEEVHGVVIVGGGLCGLATALALRRKGIESLVVERSEALRVGGVALNVVIGCDGWNSVVAKYLGLGLPSQLPRFIVLGFASYPEGHPFGTEFSQIIADDFAVGRAPVNENLVHFFVSRSPSPGSTDVDEDAARKYVLEKVDELPDDIADMVRRCDAASSWTLTKVWYRSPWQVALAGFRRGAATVAGDAMHAMGPFIGQGGSAGLEDAVVLARSLSSSSSSRSELSGGGGDGRPPDVADDEVARREARGGSAGLEDAVVLARSLSSSSGAVLSGGGGDGRPPASRLLRDDVGAAIDEYVAERRRRVTALCLHSFAIGTLLTTRWLAVKLGCVAVLALLGGDSRRDVDYDCGRL
uniref:FAD-binding domain-containing protein n=1 Tax=Oryza punctata TaxID=4537 RepID=A0A0E0K175_ORYPU